MAYWVRRLGSGDGEGWTLLTRQIAFEPFPASVLFGFGASVNDVVESEGFRGHDRSDLGG